MHSLNSNLKIQAFCLLLVSSLAIMLFWNGNNLTSTKSTRLIDEQKTSSNPSLPSHKADSQQQAVNWANVSIDRVEVYKAERVLKLLDDGKVIKTYPMRLGFTPIGHKTQEGDGKTPEGTYTLDWRNPQSQFYKSIHISYPNAADIAQAKARGVSAGGNVMIHGSAKKSAGSIGQSLYNYFPKSDWTWGCIAVSNEDMDEIWENVKNGTEIELYP